MEPFRKLSIESDPKELKKFQALEYLMEQVVHVYSHVRSFSETLHQDEDLTLAKRSVIFTILSNGPQTVPQIAEARNVSRQSIQKVVNVLLDEGLVELIENPAHKRSSLISFTKKGKQHAFAMLEKEFEAMNGSNIPLSTEEILQATKTLQTFAEAVKAEQEEQNL